MKPRIVSLVCFLVCITLFCVLLAGIYIGDTVGSKRQKAMDEERIQTLMDTNLRLLNRVENMQAVIGNALGFKPTKDMPIGRPGTGN